VTCEVPQRHEEYFQLLISEMHAQVICASCASHSYTREREIDMLGCPSSVPGSTLNPDCRCDMRRTFLSFFGGRPQPRNWLQLERLIALSVLSRRGWRYEAHKSSVEWPFGTQLDKPRSKPDGSSDNICGIRVDN
jgi:hypothetical protein